MNILAIDPGHTIGYAMRRDNKLDFGTVSQDELLELIYDRPYATFIWNAVVYERFTSAGRISKYGLETVELIGMIKATCICSNVDFYMQMPQARKAFLEEAAKYTTKEHAIDAVAHLLAYEYKIRGKEC